MNGVGALLPRGRVLRLDLLQLPRLLPAPPPLAFVVTPAAQGTWGLQGNVRSRQRLASAVQKPLRQSIGGVEYGYTRRTLAYLPALESTGRATGLRGLRCWADGTGIVEARQGGLR